MIYHNYYDQSHRVNLMGDTASQEDPYDLLNTENDFPKNCLLKKVAYHLLL